MNLQKLFHTLSVIINYKFRENPDELYYIRKQILPHSSKNTDYVRFIEDTGAQLIKQFGETVYFKRKRSLGEFILFSDINNKIKQLNLILLGILPILFGNAAAAFSNYLIYFTSSEPRTISFVVGTLLVINSLAVIYAMIRLFIKRRRLLCEKKQDTLFQN